MLILILSGLDGDQESDQPYCLHIAIITPYGSCRVIRKVAIALLSSTSSSSLESHLYSPSFVLA